MTFKQIKRFFKKYGFSVSVRVNVKDEICSIVNEHFSILKEGDELWFHGFESDGEEVRYSDNATPEVMVKMIIDGFIMTNARTQNEQ